ncbi:MAG: hypothetical protein DMF39_04035 [Verrucomicrobia bacterium]|nr:MAG: hypothetical protein DMF39_04035 [Verrucomicrobiota bacterium]
MSVASQPDWVAHASRVLASVSSRSRTFPCGFAIFVADCAQEKIVSARRRNQHARRRRYPAFVAKRD